MTSFSLDTIFLILAPWRSNILAHNMVSFQLSEETDKGFLPLGCLILYNLETGELNIKTQG